MRSRAAFLPYPGDPFLLHYWLKFFDTYWADEVDKLYIFCNSPIEEAVISYIKEQFLSRPKVVLSIVRSQMEHGAILKQILDQCEEEYIMFIEDDGFIFKKGQVEKCFQYLESGEYDIVGSKRGSCSQEILTRAQVLWGIPTEGEGDQGPNFWPNFFFIKKETLLKTDGDFGAHTWKKGEEIRALSRPGDPYYAQADLVTGDTFVHASLQLQAMIPQNRIKYVPQYHGAPEDIEHFQRGYNLFDGLAPWCHIGSLSSGVGGILQDGHGRSLARRLIDEDKGIDVPVPNYCNTEQEKQEWERRVQWWLTFWENREIGKLDDFAVLYYNAIQTLINQYGLSRMRIERRQKIYNALGL